PATLPRGKFTVPASAWSAPPWSDLKFSVTEPHRYQYELKTSFDGQRCWAIARGDLNDDGVTSLFELEEKIDSNGEMKRVRLTITNEDE
ncbi:MAG: hypothetical protein ACHREM_04590, partial [Polyangiales bacterium]